MKRRAFTTLLGGAAAAWPLAARAQQPLVKKMLRVGTVAGTQQSSPQWAAFLRRMAELGYQEGKTFAFDFVVAANEAGWEAGYRTLAARELDIIIAIGPEIALKSALAATRTLPIVMVAIDYDPFARGYVTSMARPSGNVTGVVFQQIPPDHRGMVIVPTSPFFFRDRARIADFAFQHRIVSMFVFREWVDAGGLLSYGPSITALFGRVAEFVDRIARGAKPADLPIEQPTKFELVVNLKTARAIGTGLSTAILLRADEVIE